MKKRKICVITNTRADYSRLRTLLFALRDRKDVDLFLCVAGAHLLSVGGYTIEDIKKDGFNIDYRIYTEVDGHVLSTMTKSTGLAIIEFSSFFENHRPDIVVVHGDRFEAFAAATAASMMNIYVAHLQGGEITGTIDEHLRHAITKLAHFHFASNEQAKERIIELGENPEYVFNVGCPSVDVLLSAPKYSFSKLKKGLADKIKKEGWLESFSGEFLLLVQHPVTTEFSKTAQEMIETLHALRKYPRHILALWPNIDAGAELMVQEIKKFEREVDGKFAVVNSMPMEVFVNVMRHTTVMVGNSSAGVREACYFGTPVVNVGTRQEGRVKTPNVIDVPDKREAIEKAIKMQLKSGRFKPAYPYGEGGAGEKIADILATIPLGNSQKRLISKVQN